MHFLHEIRKSFAGEVGKHFPPLESKTQDMRTCYIQYTCGTLQDLHEEETLQTRQMIERPRVDSISIANGVSGIIKYFALWYMYEMRAVRQNNTAKMSSNTFAHNLHRSQEIFEATAQRRLRSSSQWLPISPRSSRNDMRETPRITSEIKVIPSTQGWVHADPVPNHVDLLLCALFAPIVALIRSDGGQTSDCCFCNISEIRI